MRKISFFALLALVLVPRAMAHVEASPEKVPADSVARITLAAEGERSVPAVKVTVQMPAGVTDVTARPARGWKRSVKGRIVTWSGGEIDEGKVGKFSFSAHMPARAGRVLVFPTLVTYANGEVVHWIGAESSEEPAPRVALTAALPTKPPPEAPPPPVVTTTPAPTQEEDDDGTDAWVWVVVAAVVLGLGALGAVLVRRRST
jgi:uncharacterized protein YcnI